MIYQFVVSFIFGIFFEQVFNFGWSIGVLVFLVSLILFFYFSRPQVQTLKCPGPKGLTFVLVGLAFCLGILRMSFVNISPDQNLLKVVGQKISFEATVSEVPDVRDTSTRYTVKPENSKSFVLLVSDRFPEFEYGDKIKVSGILDLPKNFNADNGTEFDYVSYLAKNKIHFLIYKPQIEKIGNSGNQILVFLYFLISLHQQKPQKVHFYSFPHKISLGRRMVEEAY